MSYGKHNSTESAKAARKANSSWRNKLRLSSPQSLMGDEDLLDDDCYGYTGTQPLAKPEPRERTQSGKLGHHTGVKQGKLLQDLVVDDGNES